MPLETNIQSKWPVLRIPPVVMAIFQIRFEQNENDLTSFLKFDAQLRLEYPLREDNIQASIDVGQNTIALGVSKISGTSNAKIAGYTYYTNDKKRKLIVEEGSVTFTDENKYEGWEPFKTYISKYVKLLNFLSNRKIKRTSIRFINQFIFDKFENPIDYFNTTVASSQGSVFPFPIVKYGFNLLLNVNETTYSIVNHNLDNPNSEKFIYMFDIDVLDKNEINFDEETILNSFDSLREIKNQIFFSSITDKTKELCN